MKFKSLMCVIISVIMIFSSVPRNVTQTIG
jgi:hypothetical protein